MKNKPKILTERTFYKLLGLFSLIRGYNIILLCIAQYLAAIFILAHDQPIRKIILDDSFFMLVLASAISIAGGYIINSFYDFEKDIINKPLTSMIMRLISQNTKLVGYFVLNFLAIIVAGYVSFRAILFFSGYIFGMWIYSHRIKRIPFIGNIISAALAITPFFAVFLYYKNTEPVIIVHAVFLYLLILIKSFIKDLTTIPGDLTHNYQTIPVKYGEKKAKIVILAFSVFALLSATGLILYFEIGKMKYYFGLAEVILIIINILLWNNRKIKEYHYIFSMLKLLLALGVFSVFLIKS